MDASEVAGVILLMVMSLVCLVTIAIVCYDCYNGHSLDDLGDGSVEYVVRMSEPV